MQYGLMGRRQEIMRQIWELHQQLKPAREDDTDDPVSMELGTILIEEGRRDEGEQTSQSTEPQKNYSSQTQITKG